MQWMKESLGVLAEINAERAAKGEKPVPRKKGRGSRAFDKGWMTDDEWAGKVTGAGFDILRKDRRLTSISQRGLELVGAYGGLAEVLMSGYPVEIASACLQRAAGRAFDHFQVTELPRYWLEIIAHKPSSDLF